MAEQLQGRAQRAALVVAANGAWLLASILATVIAYYWYLGLINGYLMVNQDRYVLRVVTGIVVLFLLVVWIVAVVALQRWLSDTRTPRHLAGRAGRALGGALLVLAASYAVVTYGVTRYVG